MKIARYIITLIFCMSFLAISGCVENYSNNVTPGVVQSEEENTAVETENTAAEVESKEEDTEVKVEPNEENAAATEPDTTKGWKTLQADALLNQLGEDSSSIIPLETNETQNMTIKYSIDYPESWTLDSSVFHDADNKKIAEIVPAVLLKPEQESVYLDYQPMTDFGEELVSKEAFQLKSYKGMKIVTKIPTEAGIWYPHMYRISDGTYGFSISFYSVKPDKDDQELFDKIMSTFSFEP